ncbi:uncharacterized protein ASCRUDRAFT_74451 [Ascoidea rubescens DSM 1968]|uniref:Uncharacterized protein n=1 Tax=Ascoidea rubescens DSM 1968 TaxID=1344418 RepID=A0A1D2VN52_9ASCO|nr:hypothetical protein ASCRUDRAFT_74451 [Ascoidea rubescens DSM 1968]ODV63042.1 hypothetical protein ASCRUDRAFT_74451 [Ascoidea rubescens DSM 1968]
MKLLKNDYTDKDISYLIASLPNRIITGFEIILIIFYYTKEKCLKPKRKIITNLKLKNQNLTKFATHENILRLKTEKNKELKSQHLKSMKKGIKMVNLNDELIEVKAEIDTYKNSFNQLNDLCNKTAEANQFLKDHIEYLKKHYQQLIFNLQTQQEM